MSATGAYNYVHPVTRDGAVVLVKTCRLCGQEKRCVDGPESDFALSGWHKGKRRWNAYCKPCRRLRRHDRLTRDPAYAESVRRKNREAARRARSTSAGAERQRQASRRWYRRVKKRNPEYLRETARMGYALRAERQGRPVKKQHRVDTRPVVPAEPFAAWLEAYMSARGDLNRSEVFAELGLDERRARYVRARRYPNVSLDVVDRALLNARTYVRVCGVNIVTLDDLYPYEAGVGGLVGRRDRGR